MLSCSREQLRYLSVSVSGRLPLQAADFACLLPRALCLYIFSFLDPRSLCRCAQVQTLNTKCGPVASLHGWPNNQNEHADTFFSCRLWTGELALEEHRGAGPAVDAQVSAARLVRRFLPHAVGAGRLEGTLHPVCAGAATQPAAGQEIRPRISIMATG